MFLTCGWPVESHTAFREMIGRSYPTSDRVHFTVDLLLLGLLNNNDGAGAHHGDGRG
jgi:hypothetical protein